MINSILNYDAWLTQQANSIVGNYSWFDTFITYVSVGLVYAVPVILIGTWFYSKYSKVPTLQMLFSAIISWLVFNKLFAHFIWYRPRPYVEAGLDIKELLFHRPDYSFPSDHATLFAAITVSAWLCGYKKLGWWFFGMGLIVMTSRVIIGVHFPLDIVAGIISGTLGAFVIHWLKAPLIKYIYNPFIKLMQKIHLA